MVLERLVDQLVGSGSVVGRPVAKLGLVYGHATAINADMLIMLMAHFAGNGWELYGPDWIELHLRKMALRSYDNQVASVAAKLRLPRRAAGRMEIAA